MKQSPIVNTHNQRLPGVGREEKRLAEVARMDSDTIGDLRRKESLSLEQQALLEI